MVRPGTRERDEAVRQLVQRSVTAMAQTNDAYDDRHFLENRQFYGNLCAFAQALTVLGANIDFETEFDGDLVRITGYTMKDIEF